VVIVPVKRAADGKRVLGLPKGHPEKGESAEQAAVREVREEAGVWGRVIGSLGVVEYEYERKGKRVAKRVEFFLIEYEGGDPADHDHEIEEAMWMPLRKAANSLTFEGEREMVKRALSPHTSGL
jgi:ADP-ribose pyrophosphatase YjhB (NUDIX family)